MKRKDKHLRKSIQPVERLTLTLRFFTTGDSYHSLMYLFQIPVTTISKIIPEVCTVIYQQLKGEYLKVPNTQEEWLKEAHDFESSWNFPHCLGALVGKHVVIKGSGSSGSTFYNHKENHSMVLMALVNANYKFTYIEVESNGQVLDEGDFRNSSLSKVLEENIPEDVLLNEQSQPVPYFVVADEAFPLSERIMKPFPTENQSEPIKIFNYRLSRAHTVVEDTLGIISKRLRILRRPIELQPEKVAMIVRSICVLHNFLLDRNKDFYIQGFLEEKEEEVKHGI